MTTPDLDRSDLSANDTFRIAPLFPETNRGVQAASAGQDRQTSETSDERSRAWRAVMAGHLL